MACVVAGLGGCAVVAAPESSPPVGGYLPRAHSHNDYERESPLVDALARGFASVEVDVVLEGGELLVAHDPDETLASATLRGLYLDPLRERAGLGDGRIYPASDAPLQLLIDVKTEARATYRALDGLLAEYDGLFTRWTPSGVEEGAVTAVLSGNRAIDLVSSGGVRRMAIDGRIDEPRTMGPDAIPLVSIDWEDVPGSTPTSRLTAAGELVRRVQAEGRKIRFWGTPDDESLWSSLLALGVDFIGTDEPARLERLLRRAQ